MFITIILYKILSFSTRYILGKSLHRKFIKKRTCKNLYYLRKNLSKHPIRYFRFIYFITKYGFVTVKMSYNYWKMSSFIIIYICINHTVEDFSVFNWNILELLPIVFGKKLTDFVFWEIVLITKNNLLSENTR